MPIKLVYNEQNAILYAFCKGILTVEEFTSAMNEIISSKEYPADVRTLWDAVEFDASSVDSCFITQLIAIRGNYPTRSSAKLALFAPEDLGFGVSRMYEAWSDELPQNIRVFRRSVEAEKWLLEE